MQIESTPTIAATKATMDKSQISLVSICSAKSLIATCGMGKSSCESLLFFAGL